MNGKHCTNYILSAVNIRKTWHGLNTYPNTFQPENEFFLNTIISAPKKGVFIKKK